MNYVSLHQQTGGFRALAARAGHNPAYKVYQLGFETQSIPHQFSVFVPPGMVRLTLYLYMAEGSMVACAMRHNGLPDPAALSLATWCSFPFSDGEVGGMLDGKTYVPRPLGGHQTIIDRHFRTPTPAGGWINLRLYQVKGAAFKFQYVCDVDEVLGAKWFGAVKWAPDGDPIEGQAPAPQPQPEPIPAPDPTPAQQAGTVSVTRGRNSISITVTWPEGFEMVMK